MKKTSHHGASLLVFFVLLISNNHSTAAEINHLDGSDSALTRTRDAKFAKSKFVSLRVRNSNAAQQPPKVAVNKGASQKSRGHANQPKGANAPLSSRADIATVQPAAPPRSIADITAILDQQKPDPQAMADMQAAANAPEPTKIGRAELARFLNKRCLARDRIGDKTNGTADCERAVQLSEGASTANDRVNFLIALAFRYSGNGRKELPVLQKAVQIVPQDGRGLLFTLYRLTAQAYIGLGDLDQAAVYVKKGQDFIIETRKWDVYSRLGPGWEADVQQAKSDLLAARGQFVEAEKAYKQEENLRRQQLRLLPAGKILNAADGLGGVSTRQLPTRAP